MEIFFFVTVLITPALVIPIGLWMWKRPPREINWAMGYRTSRSMKSQQAWDFAQVTCGKIWTWCNAVMLPLSALAYWLIPMESEYLCLWIVGVQLVVLAAAIVPVEIALAKRFDKK